MTKQNKKEEATEPTPDLKDRQADFFEEYFKKGTELIRSLVAENQRLRDRLSEVEANLREASIKINLTGVSHEVERDHNDLACLFVAQGQLARAHESNEAVGVIAEILLNFIGAERFALYAANGSQVLLPLFASASSLSELPQDAPAQARGAYLDGTVQTASEIEPLERRTVDAEPLVSIPLRCGASTFGAIAIWAFLDHKDELAAIDGRLFEIIADAGGSALESSRVRGRQPRLTGPIDHYAGLALLLGLGARRG